MLESRKFGENDRFAHLDYVKVWEREHPELEARMAVDMLVKWGMVAASPDGEDSAGRQKLRLATPEELVERAIQCADLLCAKMRERRWFHVAPSINDEPKEATDGE